MADSYVHNATYAFAENKVIMFNELEGLEITLNKFQRMSYENKSWLGKATTFVGNAGISVANGAIDLFNYAGDLDRADQAAGGFGQGAGAKVASDASAVAGAVSDYDQNTSLDEFGADVGEVLSNVETYEDLAGSLLAAGAVSKVSKLGTISKTSKAIAFEATSGKTTTILGRLTDTRALGETLDNVKSGMNEGGFNILKQPDKYWSIDTNMKWLQRSIDRGDVIKAASDPTDLKNIYRNGVDGKKTVYGQEVDYLKSKGYTYDPDTQSFIQQ